MYIVVNDMVDEPLYMQIRSQIIAGIARGDLTAGDALPSVRRLASDLGINLHTVNKAYAVLRDLATAWRARGGTLDGFLERAAAQAKCVYGAKSAGAKDARAKTHSSCGD